MFWYLIKNVPENERVLIKGSTIAVGDYVLTDKAFYHDPLFLRCFWRFDLSKAARRPISEIANIRVKTPFMTRLFGGTGVCITFKDGISHFIYGTYKTQKKGSNPEVWREVASEAGIEFIPA